MERKKKNLLQHLYKSINVVIWHQCFYHPKTYICPFPDLQVHSSDYEKLRRAATCV